MATEHPTTTVVGSGVERDYRMLRRDEIIRSFVDAYSMGGPERVIAAESDSGSPEEEDREVIAPSPPVVFLLIAESHQARDSSGSEEDEEMEPAGLKVRAGYSWCSFLNKGGGRADGPTRRTEGSL
jgi:hypothetical protein